MRWATESAHWIGAVPLAWLGILWLRGRRPAAAWWIMAAAFFVSWIADTVTHYVPHPLVSQTYPLLQASLFCAVLIPRRAVEVLVAGLIMIATLSVLARDAEGLDTALHLAAWGSIAVCAGVEARGLLRVTLVVGFWALCVSWLWFAMSPDWTTWGTMQAVRLATAAAWCVAATRAARA